MRRFWILLFMLVVPAAMFAQGVTTAAFNGVVTDQKGNPLVGANVVAVHEPSGTRYGATTREDGWYNIPNVRVGGPYTITVSYLGYKEEKVSGIYLKLGEDRRVNFRLVETALPGEEVTVVAEENPIMSAARTGALTLVSEERIESLPTIQRSIQDFARLSPLIVGTNIGSSDNIGGVNVAGKSNRYNNIQVDGAILNDVFGLPASGTPGGQANAQPISLDAVQEFQVSVAPFDVRQSGFAGGLINIITRSGTNRFEGSAYYFGRNEDFVSDADTLGGKLSTFDEFQTGFRLGGPIVKNKAFFFVSGELKRRDDPLEVKFRGETGAVVFDLPTDSLQRIIDIVRNKFGYDPGGFNPFTRSTDDNKIFARLDINLSDHHRLTLRHNFVDANLDRGLTRSSSTFSLESQLYEFLSTTNSTVAELTSTLGDNLANEARLSATFVRDKRDPKAQAFPQVEVFVDNKTVRFGVERFSQANKLDQDIIEFTDNLSYYRGNHVFTFGTHNEFYSFTNLFIQDFYGRYRFNSIADLENDRPSRFTYSYSLTGNPRQTANWDAYLLGFYAQDNWKVTNRLNVTYGLRLDVPIFPDDPFENPNFAAQFPGRSTSKVPSGNLMWAPRLGFNYAVDEARKTQIRGGIGVFNGRNPFVWLSNQYSNTGMDFARLDLRDPNLIPGLANRPTPGSPISGANPIQTTEINITDPDFKFPQALRTDIAVDHELIPGYIGTVEFLYTKNINDIDYVDLNLGQPIGRAFDGRPLYRFQNESSDFTRVLLLKNTSEGYQWDFTVQLEKLPGQGLIPGLTASLAYTLGEAKDVNSGRSSRAISNWQFNETVDPNNAQLARSDFEIRHRILATASYRFKYGNGFGTTVTLFYEGRSGRPFNYIYNGDANGDGARFNDLAYIPASPDEIILQDGTWDELNAFIESREALRNARGHIIGRNADREPWVNQLDFRLLQDIPTVRGQKIQLSLDILNVLNLLSPNKWGFQKFMRFQSYSLFRFRGYDEDTGKPILSFFAPKKKDGEYQIFDTDNLLSRWQIQLGIRYTF